jgi:hypothetical protein
MFEPLLNECLHFFLISPVLGHVDLSVMRRLG